MPDQSWVPSLCLHSYPCQPSSRSSPAPLRHRLMKQSKLFQSQQRGIPLGWLKTCKFRLSSCPSFPKSHPRLSSLSYNASSPNPPCAFPARDALVHCLGVWPPPSTPKAPSTVINVQSQQGTWWDTTASHLPFLNLSDSSHERKSWLCHSCCETTHLS